MKKVMDFRHFVLVGISIIGMISFVIPASAETLWEKRQKSVQETPGVQTTVEQNKPSPITNAIDPFKITIPEQYGTIIDSYKGTNGSLIIHIQDAHVNYEAQKNIAGILEELAKSHKVSLILREGGSTAKDFTYLRNRGTPEARINACEKLLRNADITGVNYFNITTNYPVSMQGIEDRALYDENRTALWEMDKFKGPALEYLTKLIQIADQIKPKLYNEDLLALDKAKQDYENETLDLVSYYNALNDIIKKKGIGIQEFQNFTTLIKINELEKDIDMVKIRTNNATNEDKEKYEEYQELMKKLNINKLFKEEGLIEDKIQKALSQTPGQEKLYKISKALSILDKMLRVKVVPEEYDYFLQNKQDFNPATWVEFVKSKIAEQGLTIEVPQNAYAVTDNLPKIEHFYSTAGKRDSVFISKSEERMKKDNIQTAILVAGGFHTPKLVSLLVDKGYSYVVISPKVNMPTDDNLYREKLKGEWLPE